MEISPHAINLDEYIRDEDTIEKHRKNQDFLRLAISNVEMSKRLGLAEGLTYVCTDEHFFEVLLPSSERVFYRHCMYGFPESRTVVASHHVFLKNGWTKEPTDLDNAVEETGKAYAPLTDSLPSGQIRSVFKGHCYSDKIFECNEARTTIRPVYLPLRIEL